MHAFADPIPGCQTSGIEQHQFASIAENDLKAGQAFKQAGQDEAQELVAGRRSAS